jgi:hypothetical protein
LFSFWWSGDGLESGLCHIKIFLNTL